jgi:hypothetical protein
MPETNKVERPIASRLYYHLTAWYSLIVPLVILVILFRYSLAKVKVREISGANAGRVHDKILQTRKIKRQSGRQLLPLPSTGTTVREARVSYGETKSWRPWEAIGLG